MKNLKEVSLPIKWQNIGLSTQQQAIDTINEAYKNKEKLGSNIYVGNTNNGNICIILSSDGSIDDAFPVKISKDDYFEIKKSVENLGLPNDMYNEIVSLFLGIDINNYREMLIENISQYNKEYTFDLFECYITEDITVINCVDGKIAIGTSIIKNYLYNNKIL